MLFVVGGILLCLVILVFLILVVESRILSYQISKLSLEEKRTYYQKKIHLFQLETASIPNTQIDIKTATQLIRDSFQTKKTVSVQCRGLNISNHLRIPNKIILYIHGAWSGLFQKHPLINGYLSVDAVRGAISRFAFLKLDLPVIAFQLPTEPTGTLNFGLKDDQMVLGMVIQKLIQMNPDVQIILYGVCVGALRIQTYLSESTDLKNIDQVILESPLPCIKRLVSFSKHNQINEGMYYLFCLLLPSYRRHPVIKDFIFRKPTLLFGCEEDRLCTQNDLLFLQTRNFPHSKIIYVKEKWNHGELFKSNLFKENVLCLLSNSIPSPQRKQNKDLKHDQ